MEWLKGYQYRAKLSDPQATEHIVKVNHPKTFVVANALGDVLQLETFDDEDGIWIKILMNLQCYAYWNDEPNPPGLKE